MSKSLYALHLALILASLGCASQPPAAATTTPAAPEPEAPAPVVVAEAPPAQAEAPATPAPEPVPADSARPAHWGYSGEESPAHWADLSPAYAACASGTQQSPIDLPANGKDQKGAWTLSYGKSSLSIAHHEHVHDIQDNGHTIQVTVDEGSTLKTEKNEYALLQFHFHTPSENTVDGKHYPMEAHFVHQASDKSFAVVAVFFEEGKVNANLAHLIEQFPAQGEGRDVEGKELDLRQHVPSEMHAYAFTGSFTTPPCTPDVEWFVLKKPLQASSDQLAAFAARLNNNNRPPQALNGREVGIAKLRGKSGK